VAYKDFKSYIQANYSKLLLDEIQKFVSKNYDGRGFHSFGLISLLDYKVENLEVRSLTCHEDAGPRIKIDVHCKADIVSKGLGTSDYEADRKTRWFTVYVSAVLHHGLHQVTPLNTDEYSPGKYDHENVLDAYLVPYIKSEELEDIADDFTQFCCDRDDYNGWDSPLKKILDELDLTWYEADLPQGEMGRMYFREQEETVDEFVQVPGKRLPVRQSVRKLIEPGTMLISTTYYFINGYGSRADTIAHEIVHWDKHDKFFEILALLNGEEKTLYCESTPAKTPDGLEGVARARWWAEWQANSLAPRYLMPRWIFNYYFPKIIDDQREVYGGTDAEVMQQAIDRMAGIFGVSAYEAKLRALQLGYKLAEGTFIRIKGHDRPPFSFDPDALGDHQTFILNGKNGSRIYETDPVFAELIDSGKFIYTGYLVCINDPLYVKKTDDPSYPQGYELTDYALAHVDECCLKFTRHYTQENQYTEYYNECYFSKDINSADFTETREIEYESNQDILEQQKNLDQINESIDEILTTFDTLPMTFWGTFDAHMKRVKKEDGKKMTNEELSFRTGFSKDYIGSLRKGNCNVTFPTVCALCIGLHLHPVYSDDMVRKAVGQYPLTKEGINAQRILHKHFRESLKLVNDRLKMQGLPTWGQEDKIIC
jgi:hypothetical protein